MSVHSSTTNSDLVAPGYARALASGVAIWLALFLVFTWTIDPYGVSPVRLSLQGINAIKPKRVDIDRLIKPYEVWRHQPRTLFLGTSRVHQSIDPAVLDGTRFAPAYNASMPAGSMDMHAAYLRQYIQLDPNLRTVIVELFLPNFIGGPAGLGYGTWPEFIRNAVTLFASADTLWDSASTLVYNAVSGRPTFQVSPGGYLERPPGRDTQAPFEGFAAYIWSPQVSEPDRATFNQRDHACEQPRADFSRDAKSRLCRLLLRRHWSLGRYPAMAGQAEWAGNRLQLFAAE
jgi:hypothetical protein